MTPQQEAKQRHILSVAYHDFKKSLDQHSFFKLNNRTLSEDLVQDTFLKTWKYLVRGGKIDVMKAFLYHVLNALIIDEYRKRKTVSLDALVENGFEAKETDSEQVINTLDSKNAIFMIARLPAKYQQVMRMKYVQDLSLKEMSQVTGQSKNTLAVQINRGLKMLKKFYPLTI